MYKLEIKLQPHWKKRQTILFIVTVALTLALLYMISVNLFQDPVMGAIHGAIFLVFILQSIYRVRYLKALYLRINDLTISWRLIAELDIQQRLRPPISEAELAWHDITRVRNMATGMYFTVQGEEEEHYLPLSNFSYAQRQEIKSAVAAHAGDFDEEVDVTVESATVS